MEKKSKVILLILLLVVIIYVLAFSLLIKPTLDAAVVTNDAAYTPKIDVNDLVDEVVDSDKFVNAVNQEVSINADKIVDGEIEKILENKTPLIVTTVANQVSNQIKKDLPAEIDTSWSKYIKTLLNDDDFKTMLNDEITEYETGIISKTIAEQSGTSVEYINSLINESIKDQFSNQKNEIVDRVVEQLKSNNLSTETEKNNVVVEDGDDTYSIETKPFMNQLNYLSSEEYEIKRQELLNSSVNDLLGKLEE